jgi:FkbM family methyltransferase
MISRRKSHEPGSVSASRRKLDALLLKEPRNRSQNGRIVPSSRQTGRYSFTMVRAFIKRVYSKIFDADHRDGYNLTFCPTSMSTMLWYNSHYSDDDHKVIGRILRPADTFVDVGANIGELSLFAARCVGKKGFVLSIEAHPRTFSYLKRNIEMNPHLNVQAINAAAGDRAGEVCITSILSDDQNCVAEQSECHVPCVTLDELLPGSTRIRLLKLDVEGYEKCVLGGAARVLARTDYVYFEAWDRHSERYRYKTHAIADILRSNGFRVPEFDSSRNVNVLATSVDMPLPQARQDA